MRINEGEDRDGTTGEDAARGGMAGEDAARGDTAGEDAARGDMAGEDAAGEDRAGEDTAGEIQTGEILDYYRSLPERSSQETIVEMLRELQDVNGCISPSVTELAAEAAGVKAAMIQAVVKRYPSLKTAPYSHEIILCTGRNCSAKGSSDTMRKLKEALGIRENGISGDGTVCLKTRSCLKSCRTAPNVMIDGRMCSGLDAKGILRELKRL